MTKQEATEVVQSLVNKLGLPMPEIRWHHKTVRGKAQYSLRGYTWIYLGPNMWTGEQCIVHEVAHLLQFKENGYKGGFEHHGKHFISCLNRVIAAWDKEYDWRLEYPSVATAAGSSVLPYGTPRIKVKIVNNLRSNLGLSEEKAKRLMEKMLEGL